MQIEKKELLRELADDLINDNLEVTQFLFTRFFQDRDHYKRQSGTVGCPLGHWARKDENWDITDDDIPYVPEYLGEHTTVFDPIIHASEYFGIPVCLAEFFFIPHEVLEETFQYDLKPVCEEMDLHYLKDKPDPKPVGKNIHMILDMSSSDQDLLEFSLSKS